MAVVMSSAPFGSAFTSLPPAQLVLNQTLSVKAGREFIYQRYFPSSVFSHLFSGSLHQLP